MTAVLRTPAPVAVPDPPPEADVVDDGIRENADGSVVIILKGPVHWKGDELARVTIPALRGKHMRSAPNLTEHTQIGEVVTWALSVVEPLGVVDVLYPEDALRCAEQLTAALGKSRASHGGRGSPT